MVMHLNVRWRRCGRSAALAAALVSGAVALAPHAARAQVVGGGQSHPQAQQYPGASNYSFECSSINGRYTECRVPSSGSVQLLQQLSDAPCRAGRTWGRSGARVWVNDGCRARFQVTTSRRRVGYESPGRGGRRGRDRGIYDNGGRDAILVRCESMNFRPQRCDVDSFARSVRVLRSIGSTDCVQGQSWGYLPQRQQIWVDHGCRADFEVIR